VSQIKAEAVTTTRADLPRPVMHGTGHLTVATPTSLFVETTCYFVRMPVNGAMQSMRVIVGVMVSESVVRDEI